MLITYILLLIFAGLSVGYEFYMGFACSSHDCMAYLLTGVHYDQDSNHHFIDKHKPTVIKIGVFWKTR